MSTESTDLLRRGAQGPAPAGDQDRRPRRALRPEVLLQTLHLQRRSLAVWSLALVLLVAMYGAIWPSLRDQPILTDFMDRMPEVMRSLLADADMSTPVGYVQAEVLSITGPLLVILYAVSSGAGGIAGEEDRRRLDMLLANPVSRTRVVLEKAGAMTVGVLVLVTAIGLSLVVGGWLGGPEIPVGRVVAAMAHLSLLGLVFGALAAAVGGLTGNLAASRAVPAVVAVLAYAVNGLAPLVPWLEPLQDLSPFAQYTGARPLVLGFSPGDATVAVLTAAVLIAVSVVGFRRRDIGV